MIKCGRCGKELSIEHFRIEPMHGEHFRILARFKKENTKYGKTIELCDSCNAELNNWLYDGGYADQDIPALPVMNISGMINDLNIKTKRLSDILEKENHDKDNKIRDLEAELELTRCVGTGMDGFCTDLYYDENYVPGKLDRAAEMLFCKNLIISMCDQGSTRDELSDIIQYSMVIIDADKKQLNWQQAAIDFHVQEMCNKYMVEKRNDELL